MQKAPKGFDPGSWFRVGGLSAPSKMPGYAYSLPAQACITGAVLHSKQNSVCSGCYALRGRYLFPVVRRALERRLVAIREPFWYLDMVTVISDALAQGHQHFRWHDSGDLQDVAHLQSIKKIAARLPKVSFWLPTREIDIVAQDLGTPTPFNLVIRESCHFVDSYYPSKNGNLTSTVHSRGGPPPVGYVCPASTQENKCQNCRACWNPKIPNISYPKH